MTRWPLLLLAFLVGCELLLPPAPEIQCRDIPEVECTEVWQVAATSVSAPSQVRHVLVERTGGAAECVPGPCLEDWLVTVELVGGRNEVIHLMREPGGVIRTYRPIPPPE